MVDTTHVPSVGYMEIVESRNAATLFPIIANHILPGTVLWSDKWAAYNRVSTIPDVAGHHECTPTPLNHIGASYLYTYIRKGWLCIGT